MLDTRQPGCYCNPTWRRDSSTETAVLSLRSIGRRKEDFVKTAPRVSGWCYQLIKKLCSTMALCGTPRRHLLLLTATRRQRPASVLPQDYPTESLRWLRMIRNVAITTLTSACPSFCLRGKTTLNVVFRGSLFQSANVKSVNTCLITENSELYKPRHTSQNTHNILKKATNPLLFFLTQQLASRAPSALWVS